MPSCPRRLSTLTWTSTGPLLAFGVAAPILGKLGDLRGYRRLQTQALRLRQVLLERGIPSGLYVETTDPQTAADSEPYERYAEQAQPGDVLVYQFATASHLAPWLLDRTETLVLNYHNVTPPEYYAPWDNGMARHQLLAQTQLRGLAPRAALGLAVSSFNELAARTHLRTLAPRTKLGVAVSDFNEAELLQAGYERTAVVPPAASVSAPAPWRSPRQSAARWLSVGRLAPNKSLQHAVMALLVARAHDDPGATLDLVGRSVVPSYTAALHRFIDEMGLRQAVTFRGQLDDDGLARAMAEADVLVVASAHEGFGGGGWCAGRRRRPVGPGRRRDAARVQRRSQGRPRARRPLPARCARPRPRRRADGRPGQRPAVGRRDCPGLLDRVSYHAAHAERRSGRYRSAFGPPPPSGSMRH